MSIIQELKNWRSIAVVAGQPWTTNFWVLMILDGFVDVEVVLVATQVLEALGEVVSGYTKDLQCVCW